MQLTFLGSTSEAINTSIIVELAKRDKQNYPYVTAVNNSSTIQFFLIVECIVFTKAYYCSIKKARKSVIS